MSDIIMGQAYTPAEAERGKFAVVNPSTLSAMGLTGSYGRYAVLTYNVAPAAVINFSGTTVNVDVCAIDVSNWDALIAETYTDQPLSANVSVQNWPAVIDAHIVGTNSVAVCVLNFSNSVSTITFDPTATFLEIFNNDESNKIYVSYERPLITSINTLSARGLPINSEGYYSIEKTIHQFVVGAISASDIRIFGHSR